MAQRVNRTPALVVSVLLHVAIIGGSLVAWPWKKEIRPLAVTPVTLLTSEDLAALSAAEQSDVPAPAQTPEPDPVAEPAPVTPEPAPEPQPAPAPAPRPAPPKPAPEKPTPTPTPAPSKPAPTRKAPAKPTPRLNLDDLAESLAKSAPKAGGSRRSGGSPGLSQLEKDLQARRTSGAAKAATASALGLVQAKLIRLWNPNCGVTGANALQVRVRIFLNRGGGLARPAQLVDYSSVDAISDPVMKAAASRALSAVGRGAPFEGLPVEDYDSWKQFIVRFDGKEACR
jgi:outer membrane biosynthesis protein TonB